MTYCPDLISICINIIRFLKSKTGEKFNFCANYSESLVKNLKKIKHVLVKDFIMKFPHLE